MKIVNTKPPEWIMSGCLSQFRVNIDRTFWTYGDTIYNPGGMEIPDHIIEHEEKHADQQRDYIDPIEFQKVVGEVEPKDLIADSHKGKDAWWRRFLSDPAFRVEQEAEAYGAQYRYFCARRKDRNERNRFLVALTTQLSGPLYQSAIKPSEARDKILKYANV